MCRSCKKVTTVDYTEEALCLIFGDTEAQERLKITKLLGASEEKEDEYYFYEVGYCDDCYDEHHNLEWESPRETLDLIAKIESPYHSYMGKIMQILDSDEMIDDDSNNIFTLMDKYNDQTKEDIETLTRLMGDSNIRIYTPCHTNDVDKESHMSYAYPKEDSPQEKYHIEKTYAPWQILDSLAIDIEKLELLIGTDMGIPDSLRKRIYKEECIDEKES